MAIKTPIEFHRRSKCAIYLNDIHKGDRVFIVDDVASLEELYYLFSKELTALLEVGDCWIVFEKEKE